MMDPRTAKLLAALELRQQSARAKTFCAADLGTARQREVLLSKAERKKLVCGRRAGKTETDALGLFDAALDPRPAPVLYVTLTRNNAKEIIWDTLLRINTEQGLGFTERLQDLELVSPAGIPIQLRGCHSPREIAKIRGKKFKRAILDECQSIPDRILKPLVTSEIGPTLMDYQGDFWLSGTPPPIHAGFWWDIITGKAVRKAELHHWNVRENEKLPAVVAGVSIEKILRDILDDNGWEEDDPTYLCEYLADLNVEDLNALLYQWDDDLNGVDELPTDGEWHNVLCLDLGFEDEVAAGILGWRNHERVVYLRFEDVINHLDITSTCERLKPIVSRYKPFAMVVDEGGLGKMIAEEMRRQHGLPFEAAEKTQKGAHIKLLNGGMRKGQLKALKASRFRADCKMVKKDFEAMARDGGKLQELPMSKGGFHSNICDSVLYGWRKCQHYWEKDAPQHPAGYQEPSDFVKQQLKIQKALRRGGGPLGNLF